MKALQLYLLLYRKRQKKIHLFLFIFLPVISLFSKEKVELGVDRFFFENWLIHMHGKKVGLITNHTGVNRNLESTVDLFKQQKECSLVAVFSPEHGLEGDSLANEKVQHKKIAGVVIYSLHGDTKRPTDEMLKNVDFLVYDIQEIGCRSYTYCSTLFYAMEEAAKKNISVYVLDRPNPMGGVVVDGPLLQEQWRSFLGYVNVPYCHGMTIGELAQFFNEEYKIGCKLTVVPMRGWKRTMTFQDTGLTWIPPSPYIPESDTPFFYASTGVLGTLGLVNIGIGYTLPFKLVGAPWIRGKEFAEALNKQKLPGVKFVPFHFRPFYGRYKAKSCQGVKIVITDPQKYRPMAVQYLLIGILKTMYPKIFQKQIDALTEKEKRSFCLANGNEEILNLAKQEKYAAWKMIQFQEDERKVFLEKRKKYLLYSE